ncbi:MAG: hypothetical protein AMS22_12660 [Thiotrichales bacterium SG8_50]|nr:MAG: hypothetical protein AMS22_12660 [Thiotrichales bacterium SG8_50]
MAVINRRYRYLFLAEPHTASRALRNALLQHTDSHEVGSHHSTLKDLKRRGVHGLSKCYPFSVVRNPADILVTKWLLSLPGLDLAGYLKQLLQNCRDPYNLLFLHNHYTRTHLHYEALQHDLDTFFGSMGIPFIELPTVGATPGKRPWREYYGLDELNLLLAYCKELPVGGYDQIIYRMRRKLLDKQD